jgi:hypothetical protein
MANIVPAQLTSAEGLFRDRFNLTPENVKGVDSTKLDNVRSLIENRLDIEAIPWRGNFPEATSVSSVAKNSGVKETVYLNAPKATSAEEAFLNAVGIRIDKANVDLSSVTDARSLFRGARINSFNGITMNSLEIATGIFQGVTIDQLDEGVTTSAVLTNIVNGMADFKVLNMQQTFIFSDTTAVEWFNNQTKVNGGTSIPYMIGLSVLNILSQGAGTGSSWSPYSEVWNIPVFRNCEWSASVYSNFFTNDAGGVSVIEWGVTLVGDVHTRASYLNVGNRPMRTPNLVTVPAGHYDNVTAFVGDGTSGIGHFKDCSLSQASVDNVIKSFHRAIVINAAPWTSTAPKRFDITGSNNASPSAGVVFGEIAALTAAGFTVTHN